MKDEGVRMKAEVRKRENPKPEVLMTIEARSTSDRAADGFASVFGHSSLIRHSGFDIRACSRSGLRLAALGLCLSLFLTACEKTQSELFKPQLVVHGLVRAGYPGVQVNINRSYAIDEPFDTMFPGASGLVWRGTDTWSLVNYARDAYETREPGPWPASGDTFGVRIAKDGFDTVYGRTVVPDSFRILFPREGDTVSMNDSMVWTRSRNCAGYDMSITVIAGPDTSFFDLAMPNDTTAGNLDSTVFRLSQMFFLYQVEPGIHVLRLYALDTSYFDWVSAGGFGFGGGGGDTTHLVGGLGVFGSAVVESLTVYVRTDTAGPRCARVTSDQFAVCRGGNGPSAPAAACERETEYGARLARRGGLNALWSGSGVVSAQSPLLADRQPFRDRGQQLFTLDRLGDERVGPGLERGLDVFFGHAAGENQDRRLERPGALEYRAD